MDCSGPDSPRERFSRTADYYTKYRPGYPRAITEVLTTKFGLRPYHVVADIGSGTGIFTRLLLDNGNSVHAVEPNDSMRAAAERYLSDYKHVTSVCGSASNTTLDDNSVDMITVAQAFHWFEPEPVKKEFRRILQPRGRVVLLWNLRHPGSSPFMRAYEDLLEEFGTDYRRVRAEGMDSGEIIRFFRHGRPGIVTLPNEQLLDREGLTGRILSSSFIPSPQADNFNAMLEQINRMFGRHQQAGYVRMLYETKLYAGEL